MKIRIRIKIIQTSKLYKIHGGGSNVFVCKIKPLVNSKIMPILFIWMKPHWIYQIKN